VWSGAGEISVLDEDAAVHDDMDAGGFGALGGFGAADAQLDPEIAEAEGDHFVNNGRDGLRQAEDVDDVGLGGERGERREAGLAEDLRERGVDGEDAVALALHVGRDVVAGLGWVPGKADDGDGAGLRCVRGEAEHVAEGGGFVHAQAPRLQ